MALGGLTPSAMPPAAAGCRVNDLVEKAHLEPGRIL